MQSSPTCHYNGSVTEACKYQRACEIRLEKISDIVHYSDGTIYLVVTGSTFHIMQSLFNGHFLFDV